MMIGEWRDLEGREGIYQASNLNDCGIMKIWLTRRIGKPKLIKIIEIKHEVYCIKPKMPNVCHYIGCEGKDWHKSEQDAILYVENWRQSKMQAALAEYERLRDLEIR